MAETRKDEDHPEASDRGQKGAWERVASTSADLFLRRGYGSLSLKEIGAALGMKPGSLYYHCPGGKAQLYVRSLEFAFERTRGALDSAGSELAFPDDIQAMAAWMVRHAPLDFRRMIDVDIPAVAKSDPDLAAIVPELIHAAIFEPIREALANANHAGKLSKGIDVDVVAASTIALIDGLGAMHGRTLEGPDDATLALVAGGLRVLLHGAMRNA